MTPSQRRRLAQLVSRDPRTLGELRETFELLAEESWEAAMRDDAAQCCMARSLAWTTAGALVQAYMNTEAETRRLADIKSQLSDIRQRLRGDPSRLLGNLDPQTAISLYERYAELWNERAAIVERRWKQRQISRDHVRQIMETHT